MASFFNENLRNNHEANELNTHKTFHLASTSLSQCTLLATTVKG